MVFMYIQSGGSSYWSDDGTYLSPTTSTRHIKLIDNEELVIGTGGATTNFKIWFNGIDLRIEPKTSVATAWTRIYGSNGVVLGYGTSDSATFRSTIALKKSTAVTGHLSTSSYISQTDGATSYNKIGGLTTTERNALTAAAGMIIFNTTTTQFEGYDGSSWVAL